MAQEAVSEEQSMSPYPCGMMTAPHTVVSNSGERDILSVCQVTGLVSVFGFFVCFSRQDFSVSARDTQRNTVSKNLKKNLFA